MANGSRIEPQQARIDFSFRREVFFIIAGGILGAMVMAIPLTFSSAGRSQGYDLTWIVFGHIVGVHSPLSSVIIAGMIIHIIIGISIGIVSGIFLYKTNILNISKPSNGLRYGLFVGLLVYFIFSIPVSHFILDPEFRHTLINRNNNVNNNSYSNDNYNNNNISSNSNNSYNNSVTFSNLQISSILFAILIHLLFGSTLGLFSSLLSIKFGARYRCPSCDISFSRIDVLQNHMKFMHGENSSQNITRILILGGGFGGVGVLNKLQHKYQTDISVDITIVSKDNYLLFTPMLHEIASGTIETRHIVTPIRTFCNRSRFYCASVENIDLKNKEVKIRSSVATSSSSLLQKNGLVGGNLTDSAGIDTNGNNSNNNNHIHLQYDYLVIALGSETKFFGMYDVQTNAYTIKSLNDAIKLRNHIIYLLEQADQLLPQYNYNANSDKYNELQRLLLTFVIVGGGFAGVETAGELNDFIRDSVDQFYHNIDKRNIKVIVIQSGNRLLPEMTEQLAEFAQKRLLKSGIEVILNSRVTGATENSVKLKDGRIIFTRTIVWSGGVAPNSLISNLTCDLDARSGRIVVDKYLETPKFKGVYALGDCGFVTDPNTGNPYPPTAQHAIRQSAVVAKNITAEIEGKINERQVFDYKTKGMMASIGKRTGVGNLLGIQVQGSVAWWIWRNYYLANLPTIQKKIRVLADWMLDIFFNRDVTMLRNFEEENKSSKEYDG